MLIQVFCPCCDKLLKKKGNFYTLFGKSESYSFLVCDRCLQRSRLSKLGETDWINTAALNRLCLNPAKYCSKPFTPADATNQVGWLLSHPRHVYLFQNAKPFDPDRLLNEHVPKVRSAAGRSNQGSSSDAGKGGDHGS